MAGSQKFIGRNRLLVGGGAGMAVLLLGFALTATIQARRLRVERDAAERERALRLAEAIEGLTERQRQVVKFYYLEGLNTREIAEMLGITEGRVSQLHGSALTRLKGILQETFQV